MYIIFAFNSVHAAELSGGLGAGRLRGSAYYRLFLAKYDACGLRTAAALPCHTS